MGEPLPPDESVFRLIKGSFDDRVSPASFTLSETDKQHELRSLSVWAEQLTSPEQTLGFLEERSGYNLYASLKVSAIRALRPEPNSPEVPSLNVVWDPLTRQTDDGIVPDNRPGALGHSGITGTFREPGVQKSYYNSLRSQLADLANDFKHTISVPDKVL